MAVDKLVDSTQLDADLTSVANAIRTKGGTSASLAFPAGFVSAVEAIPTGGSGYTIDDIANRSYATGTIPYDIVIPNATRIAPFAFSNGNMRSVSAPNVKYFTQNLSDTSGNGSFIFEKCTRLESVNFPALIDCGDSGYQFSGCTALTFVNMPKSNFSTYMFNNCTSLQNIALGYGRTSRTETQTYMFISCKSLKCVDLSNVSKLNDNLIRNASACDTIILRDSAIVQCGSIYVFDRSRFANNGAGGTIYIPESLYNHLGDGSSLDYKATTNWSTYNGYGTITWAKIEGSQYENYYADGTPITA